MSYRTGFGIADLETNGDILCKQRTGLHMDRRRPLRDGGVIFPDHANIPLAKDGIVSEPLKQLP